MLMSFQPSVTDLLLRISKEDILRDVGNQTVLITIDFHCMDEKKKTVRHFSISNFFKAKYTVTQV